MKPAPASVPIATIPKNASEEVRVSLDVFKGRRLFNARVFYDAGSGQMRPSKAGVTLRLECLEQFAEAVTTALMTAKSKGFMK